MPKPYPLANSKPSSVLGKKRKRGSELPVKSCPSAVDIPYWKKGGFRSEEEAKTAFWDRLSKVPLCRSALKELDRRDSSSTLPLFTIDEVEDIFHLSQRPLHLRSIYGGLRLFARRGGPEMDQIRGRSGPNQTYLSNDPVPSRKRPTSGKMSTYDPAFPQHLIDHGICENAHIPNSPGGQHTRFKPINFDEIMKELLIPRASMLMPKDIETDKHEFYYIVISQASIETDVTNKTLYYLTGKEKPHRLHKRDLPCGNLAVLTDGTCTNPRPDFLDGAFQAQLNLKTRDLLSPYVLPSTAKNTPIAPNFFLEAKGGSGTMNVVLAQANYDGAVGARAMQYLRSYNGRELEEADLVYDNKAYTVTCYFDGHTLAILTAHLTAPEPPYNRPLCHFNRLLTVSMIGTLEDYWKAVTMFRNARDWAEKVRNELIKQADHKEIQTEGPKSVETASISQCGVRVLVEMPANGILVESERAPEGELDDEGESLGRAKRRKTGKR